MGDMNAENLASLSSDGIEFGADVDDIKFAAQFAQLDESLLARGFAQAVAQLGSAEADAIPPLPDALRKKAENFYDFPADFMDDTAIGEDGVLTATGEDGDLDTDAYLRAILKQQNLVLEEDDEDEEDGGDANGLLAAAEAIAKFTAANAKDEALSPTNAAPAGEKADEDGDDDEEKKTGNDAGSLAESRLVVPSAARRQEIEALNVEQRVAENETITADAIGVLQNVTDGLLVIAGSGGKRALDLGSTLCLKDGNIVGLICDVFGNIAQPYYLVCPTNNELLNANKAALERGAELFAVEQQSSYALDFDPDMYKQLQEAVPFLENDSDSDDSSSDLEAIENDDTIGCE